MSNIQYIIVGGFPRSGKSTFVSYCREILGENYTLDISTVDLVKSLAVKAGWDGTKTPKNRKFLSDLKQLLIEWDDIPYKDVIKTAQNKPVLNQDLWEKLIPYFRRSDISFCKVKGHANNQFNNIVDELAVSWRMENE